MIAKRIFAVGSGLFIVALLLLPNFYPQFIPSRLTSRVEDFGAYWSAAKVARSGENPYDAVQLRPLEAAIDPTRPEPIITWSPPWAISLIIPFSYLDHPAARWNWMLLQLVGVAVCSAVIWRSHGGNPDRVGIAWLLAFSFYPTLQLIALGQMSLFTLAAIVGFLSFVDRKPFLAGACLAFVLVKPHNVIPFGIAMVFWIIAKRQWQVLFGGLATVVTWTFFALMVHPSFFSLYRETMSANPPGFMMPPTLGTLLRLILHAEQTLWIPMIPTAIALIWAGWYSWRNQYSWNWQIATPPLLFASVLGSPYGWVYDSVILLIPILSLAAAVVKRPLMWLALYFAVNLCCLFLYAKGFEEVWFVWLPWMIFAGWLVLTSSDNRTQRKIPA